jgi:hypothetical protein
MIRNLHEMTAKHTPGMKGHDPLLGSLRREVPGSHCLQQASILSLAAGGSKQKHHFLAGPPAEWH